MDFSFGPDMFNVREVSLYICRKECKMMQVIIQNQCLTVPINMMTFQQHSTTMITDNVYDLLFSQKCCRHLLIRFLFTLKCYCSPDNSSFHSKMLLLTRQFLFSLQHKLILMPNLFRSIHFLHLTISQIIQKS